MPDSRRGGEPVLTRRKVLAAAGGALALRAQGDARLWIPGRRRYGAPVTHVVAGKTVPAGVRLLDPAPWPGLRVPREDGTFVAGPSGPAWIQTNAWAIQWERYRAPGMAVWLAPEKPEDRTLTTEQCLLALCDCEASGARWILECDEASFAGIAEALRFFEAHRAWRDFQTPLHIGLVASSRPEMREVMNLMCRFAVPYRLVRAPLPGMSVLVLAGSPDSAANAFAREGGLVISLGWTALTQKAEGSSDWVDTKLGAGMISAWKGPITNAQRFVKDLTAKLGEDHDVVRAFNVHASTVRYTVRDEDQRGLVQIVNFTGRPFQEVTTIWVRQIASRAVLHEWKGKPRALEISRTGGGTEISIPERGIYAAVELFPA